MTLGFVPTVSGIWVIWRESLAGPMRLEPPF
jgi:hypothetical protein